jgi:hypothetical protein
MKPRSTAIAASLFAYMLMVLAALAQSALAPLAARAQEPQAIDPAGEAAIRATALDYIEGWYEGDADRMARALHPELAKRLVITQPEGWSVLNQQGAMTLVQSTGRGGGSDTPVQQQHKDVTILDVYENAASVRIYASGWVDYLHMAKWNGEWKIVNVLFELHPEAE